MPFDCAYLLWALKTNLGYRDPMSFEVLGEGPSVVDSAVRMDFFGVSSPDSPDLIEGLQTVFTSGWSLEGS